MSNKKALEILCAPSHQNKDLLARITQPLFDFMGFTYFNYTLFFDNKYSIVLTNIPEIVEAYWSNHWYKQDPHWICPEQYPGEEYFWNLHYDNDSPNSLFKFLKEEYHLHNGLDIFREGDNKRHAYHLAGPVNSQAICKIYRDHLNLVYNYIDYFQHKAQGLIQQAIKNNAVALSELLTEPYRPSHQDIERVMDSDIQFVNSISQVLNTIPHPAQLDITEKRFPHLTRRQSDCAHLILEGKTAEEIANTLHISKRTIEDHCSNINKKLGCKNRAELVVKLMALKSQL